ncbi:MAG: M48 family metallopeptidase [Gammaproteobacteria bacterium]
MATSFYEHQDRARKRTRLLVAYYLLAVAFVVVALNGLAWAVSALLTSGEAPAPSLPQWLAGGTWVAVTAVTLAVIVGASVVTTLRLAGGGPALARMLRARQLAPSTQDADERRLLNVVEEISIASGVPVPAVYVLDAEPGINAFVAGTRPSETVMVMTRGALEHFTRDELQGVVAHEFSHIFNHDMRLNIRLMGVVAGLVVIAQLGRFMLRAGSHGRARDSAQLIGIGIAILAIGYLGSLLAAMIKAAISRQREFLADASAVQFTRNPRGIATALWRIKTHAAGSRLDSPHAEDVSHFCIAESVRYFFAGLMATHPPLDARIRAVDASFVPPRDAPRDTAPAGHADMRAAAGVVSGAAAPGAVAGVAALDGAAVAARVGAPGNAQLAHAEAVHAALPAALVAAARQPRGAAHLLLALVIARSAPAAHTDARAGAASAGYDAARLDALVPPLTALPPRQRLPLIELALPALKRLDEAAREKLCDTLRTLTRADARLTLFEFALLRIVDDHLAPRAARAVRVRHYRFAAVAGELRLLLSVLAHAGSTDAARATAAYAVAWQPFALSAGAAPMVAAACRLDALEAAFDELAALAPLLKQNVIRACADCVIHDGEVTAAEAELLEAIALTLDCPLPPLV